MKQIAIIGTGGLGREVLGIIQAINQVEQTWDCIGFYDDSSSEEEVNGYPVLGTISDLNASKHNQLHVVIAIGNPQIKEKVKNKITLNSVCFPTLIHPSAIIYSNEHVILGKGVVVAANSVLTVNIKIDDFVYINASCVIAHDTEIGKYSMIMPTVSISAGGKIGDCVYIGNGTKIDYFIEIESNSILKAGTILSK